MHFKSVPLFLIVASLTPTSLALRHLPVTARRSLEMIFPRQDLGPCDTPCAPFQATLTACTTTSNVTGCLCTTAVSQSLQVCVTCIISTDSSISVVADAQNLIDTYEQICGTVAGIPSVTIGNGTPTTATNVPSPTLITLTTPSQTVIGPSSSSAASATSSAGSIGLPSISSASLNKAVLHWTGAFLALAANLLLF